MNTVSFTSTSPKVKNSPTSPQTPSFAGNNNTTVDYPPDTVEFAKRCGPEERLCIWKKTEDGLKGVWKKAKDIIAEAQKAQKEEQEKNFRTYDGFKAEFDRLYEETGTKRAALNKLGEKVSDLTGIGKIYFTTYDEIDDIDDYALNHLYLADLYNVMSDLTMSNIDPKEIAGMIIPGHSCGFGEHWAGGYYDFIDKHFDKGDVVYVDTCDNYIPATGGCPIRSAKRVVAHEHGNRYIEPMSYSVFGNPKTFFISQSDRQDPKIVQQLEDTLAEKGLRRQLREDGNYWIERLTDPVD